MSITRVNPPALPICPRVLISGRKQAASLYQRASRAGYSPWFKKYRPEIIEEHAAAYRKAAENYQDLLQGDVSDKEVSGKWGLSSRKN